MSGFRPTIKYVQDLYLAQAETMRGVLQSYGREFVTAIMVGHNPGCEDLTRYLSNPDALDDRTKFFPTGPAHTLNSAHREKTSPRIAPTLRTLLDQNL